MNIVDIPIKLETLYIQAKKVVDKDNQLTISDIVEIMLFEATQYIEKHPKDFD